MRNKECELTITHNCDCAHCKASAFSTSDTIDAFLRKTDAYLPPYVQVALVAWFVNDMRLEDSYQLADWFAFNAWAADDKKLVH